jgi:hypothetical protein
MHHTSEQPEPDVGHNRSVKMVPLQSMHTNGRTAGCESYSPVQIIERTAQCIVLKGLEQATIDDTADVLGATNG